MLLFFLFWGKRINNHTPERPGSIRFFNRRIPRNRSNHDVRILSNWQLATIWFSPCTEQFPGTAVRRQSGELWVVRRKECLEEWESHLCRPSSLTHTRILQGTTPNTKLQNKSPTSSLPLPSLDWNVYLYRVPRTHLLYSYSLYPVRTAQYTASHYVCAPIPYATPS